MERLDVEMSALAISQSATLFQLFVPDIQQLRSSSPSTDPNAKSVRTAEFMSAVLTISIGGLLAWMAHSNKPLIVSVVITAALLGMYEWTYQGSPMEGN